MSLKLKPRFPSILLIGFISLTNASALEIKKDSAVATVGDWKIFKNSDDATISSCVAKSTLYPGITLSEKKLVVATKDTKDLKSYQVEINGQEALALKRADITDASCGCVRIRQMDRLTSNNSSFHLAGVSEQGKNVDVTLTLNDIPAVLDALKKAECSR